MSQVIFLASGMSRTEIGASIRRMSVMRAVILCLTALFTTAIWGGILYVGARLLDIPVESGWLIATLTVIFFLVLLALSMVAAASGSGDDGWSQPPPGA